MNKSDAERLVREFIHCKNDFIYFCSNYIKIELPGGDITLNPYNKQKELVSYIHKNKFVIVLKSRQIGISTIIQAYIAWLTVFYDNVVVGVISKDAPEATDFARHVMSMIDKLPLWMRPKFKKRTERAFILNNGCKTYATPVAPNAPEKTLRGKAVTLLIIDEAAFIKYIDDAWTAIVPALSTSQMHAKKNGVPYGTIVLSTPNKTVGVGKWFYEKYMNAVSNDGIFKDFTIYWKDIQELANDSSWYQTQCQLFDNDKRKIAQELELKFLSTSGTFFDEQTVTTLQEKTKDIIPIEKLKLFNGEIWVFSRSIPNRYYIIGVDTAPEHGEDRSAITVWDYETLEQVWEYQGKCKVQDFEKVVKFACAQYPGSLVIESNSYGNQIVEGINSSEYSIMMYNEKRGESKMVPGLSTNAKTRPLMIDALYSYITQFPEIVKSKRLALELTGLITKNSGKVEGESGEHDDLAMSAALAFYVRKYDPPMMLETNKFSEISNSMNNIINMNDDIQNVDFNNASIMNFVKHKVENTEIDGFIDVLNMEMD